MPQIRGKGGDDLVSVVDICPETVRWPSASAMTARTEFKPCSANRHQSVVITNTDVGKTRSGLPIPHVFLGRFDVTDSLHKTSIKNCGGAMLQSRRQTCLAG
jgi:hypothetical protein